MEGSEEGKEGRGREHTPEVWTQSCRSYRQSRRAQAPRRGELHARLCAPFPYVPGSEPASLRALHASSARTRPAGGTSSRKAEGRRGGGGR